jgi:hypothetical protein
MIARRGVMPTPPPIKTICLPALAAEALNIPYGPSINTLVPTFNFDNWDEESPNALTVIRNLALVGAAESEYGWD